ncbi:MAG: hypothetical protein HQL93_13335 [Magnetococcales bacterium]|nr:hypothetical protein [Magnetococcales bacterium]
MPSDRLGAWLQGHTQGRLTWQTTSLGWEGLRLGMVRVIPPIFTPDREIEQILLRPLILPLFLGKLGVRYQVGMDFAKLDGTVTWNGQKGRLEWQARMDDSSKLAALMLGPMGNEVKGKGDGSGWFNVTRTEIEEGEGEIQWRGLSAFGAKIEPFTLNTTVKEKNVLEIKLAGKGEIAVSGKLTLNVMMANLDSSAIRGEVLIQPIKSNLPGLAGQFLAKGQPVRFIVSGSVTNLQWRVQ